MTPPTDRFNGFHAARALFDCGWYAQLAPTAGALYILLATRFADADGLVWPSNAELGRLLGVQGKAMGGWRRQLKLAGLLEAAGEYVRTESGETIEKHRLRMPHPTGNVGRVNVADLSAPPQESRAGEGSTLPGNTGASPETRDGATPPGNSGGSPESRGRAVPGISVGSDQATEIPGTGVCLSSSLSEKRETEAQGDAKSCKAKADLLARIRRHLRDDPRVNDLNVSEADVNALFDIADSGGWDAFVWCLVQTLGKKPVPRAIGRYAAGVFREQSSGRNPPWVQSQPRLNGHGELVSRINGQHERRRPLPTGPTVFPRSAGPIEDVCRHESGHIVAGLACGVLLRRSVAGGMGGSTLFSPRMTPAQRAIIALAGEAAERLGRGEAAEFAHCPESLADAELLERGLAEAPDKTAARAKAMKAAVKLVTAHTDVIEALVKVLMRRGKISRGKALELWRRNGRTFGSGRSICIPVAHARSSLLHSGHAGPLKARGGCGSSTAALCDFFGGETVGCQGCHLEEARQG